MIPIAAGVVTLRPGEPPDAAAIARMIVANLESGHLLPRPVDEIARHAGRFLVAVDGNTVVGCAELAPLSRAVAEVRSLVVDQAWRGRGIGGRLLSALRREARRRGFQTLCALTHDPSPFVRLGFEIVPHVWFPEKIALDCTGCPRFRRCGQQAVALALEAGAVRVPMGGHARLPASAGAPLGITGAPRVRPKLARSA